MSKLLQYVIDIPEKAQSINEVERYSLTSTGLRALKNKWQQIGEHYIKKAIDKGDIPEKIRKQVKVTTWIFFDVLRNRDKDNYYLVSKALIDALVSLAVIRNDSESYVDFGGIKFRNDANNPHIKLVVEVEREPMKEMLQIAKKENPITMALKALNLKNMEELEKIAPMTAKGHKGSIGGIDTRKIKFALYMAWPSGIRPTYPEMAKELDVHPRTLLFWIHRPDVREMVLAFTVSVATTDVSDVLFAMKERSLAGDVGAARLFLQWASDALKAVSPVQVNNNTLNANVNVTPEEVKQILTNLKDVKAKEPEKKSPANNGRRNSKPRKKARATVVVKKQPTSGLEDLV